jgi:hypothetical protein
MSISFESIDYDQILEVLFLLIQFPFYHGQSGFDRFN